MLCFHEVFLFCFFFLFFFLLSFSDEHKSTRYNETYFPP